MLFLKKKHNHGILKKSMALGMLLLMLTGCDAQMHPSGTPVTGVDDEPRIPLTAADLTTECQNPNVIDLNRVETDECRITQPGCHVLSGEMNGTVRIDVEDQIVHVVLNGVTVDSAYGPALEVVSAGKVFLTLQEGSENFLSDAAVYPDTRDPDACIYSACDMTINGSGDLHVYGYYKDAVHSKDVLKILGGNLFVQSKRNGLRGNDGVVVNCNSLDVQSEKNGIQSTKSGSDSKGNIEIYGSTCSVIGGDYAIACEADLYIADSSVYAMGILGDIKVNGVSRIAEGNLQK